MKNTAICYFSGTGNSFDIALKLNEVLQEDLFYLPNTQPEALAPYAEIVLVTPIYMFGLPNPVKRFIHSLRGLADKTSDVVLHYGGFAGNAAAFCKGQFEKNGLTVRNIYQLRMPENFTIVAVVPKFYINWQLKRSRKQIQRIAEQIRCKKQGVIRKNIFSFCDGIHERTAKKMERSARTFHHHRRLQRLWVLH